MNWRNEILGKIDIGKLQNMEPGSILRSNIDLFDPKSKEKLFSAGEEYVIKRLHPIEDPKGVVLESLLGEWYVGIEGEYGGGEYFTEVIPKKLTPQEELGELGGVPFDLMKIINQYKIVSRENLYRELIFKYKIINRGGKQDIIKKTNAALELLEIEGLVETIKRPGYYKLTFKGLGRLRGNVRKED